VRQDSPVFTKAFGHDEAQLFSVKLVDGTARMLGSLMVFCAILAVAKENVADEDYQDPMFVEMLKTLMRIPTIAEGADTSNLVSKVSAIARQNQNSKVAAVSSFQWATVLKSLSSEGVTFTTAMDAYKSHPDVVAYSATAAGASIDGESGLLLDYHKDRECCFHRAPQNSRCCTRPVFTD
jgi:hypothetical protein